MSSWDALHYRLRANFDGLRSEYCKDLRNIEAEQKDPAALYNAGKEVKSLEVVDERVNVVFEDIHTGKTMEVMADLVLVADGPNSSIRQSLLGPQAPKREYAGYIAWLGVVPEHEVSEQTRKTFQRNITYSIVPGGHVIVYGNNMSGSLRRHGNTANILQTGTTYQVLVVQSKKAGGS